MAEQQPASSIGAELGSIGGGIIGGAVGGPAGAMVGSQVGRAAGTLLEPALDPAQIAQRREFKKAQQRLRSGTGYGMSRAQKQTERADSARQQAAQNAAQQAVAQQQMAAGMLSGGAVTEASRVMAAQQAAGAAQTERDIQGRSNQLAQQQYLMDLARIDAEAARSLAASQRMGAQLRESGDLSQLGIPSQSAVEKAATKAPPPASVVKAV